MPFDDELPSAPQGEQSSAVAIDDQIDASAFEGVGKVGDAMPAGTFHFRLKSFTEQLKDNDPSKPNFNLQWACQEEPHTGRIVFDTVTWVGSEDIKAANDPSNIRNKEAKAVLNSRLMRAKSIMEAAGFKPSGKFGFKEFLNTHPEIKMAIRQKEKMDKDEKGEYTKPTGEQQNVISKYISLARPS